MFNGLISAPLSVKSIPQVVVGFCIFRLNPQGFQVMFNGLISAPLTIKCKPKVVMAKPIVRSYFKGMLKK